MKPQHHVLHQRRYFPKPPGIWARRYFKGMAMLGFTPTYGMRGLAWGISVAAGSGIVMPATLSAPGSAQHCPAGSLARDPIRIRVAKERNGPASVDASVFGSGLQEAATGIKR